MHKLTAFWYQPRRTFLAQLLRPVAVVYRWIIALRAYGYALGMFKVTYFPVPVVVVGNISVGGVGKTPFVAALVAELKRKGFKPGIVSRGYGGVVGKTPRRVNASDNPSQRGDEPVMLAAQTGCPVVVHPDRVAAVTFLLKTTNCNIVVSDDGLQHFAMGRDIDIVVVDGKRRLGNGLCLPAGPLREPATRLITADFIIANGEAAEGEYAMRLVPGNIVSLVEPGNTAVLDSFRGQTIHAVAGIGNPQRFFDQLRAMGLEPVCHAFPDHHCFTPADIDYPGVIIMTEKDAVKCRAFADRRHHYLPVKAELIPTFFQSFFCQIQ